MEEINHKLSFSLRLLDAASGRACAQRGVRFYKNGELFTPLEKGQGVYFTLNMEPVDFEMEIVLSGYLDKKIRIEFSKLDEKFPMIDVYLLPESSISLTGSLKGLSEVCAVEIGQSGIFISAYDKAKKQISLFNPHSLRLFESTYAVVHQNESTFEVFKIHSDTGSNVTTLKGELFEPFSATDPVRRVNVGEVSKNGDYRLNVYDNATDLRYLIKFVVNDKAYFQEVDFHNLSENELSLKKAHEILITDQEGGDSG